MTNIKTVPPGSVCNAKDCQNEAKFYYNENEFFMHCGSIECVEKIHNQIEELSEKLNQTNEARDILLDPPE